MKQNAIQPDTSPQLPVDDNDEDAQLPSKRQALPLPALPLPTLPLPASPVMALPLLSSPTLASPVTEKNLEPLSSPLPLAPLPPAAGTIMGADEVLERLTAQARGTLAPFLAESANGWFPDLSSEEAQANLGLLKKAKFKRRVLGGEENPIIETEVEVELHDPQAALRDLGRHHKLFTDRAESVEVGLLKVEIEYVDRD